MSRRRFCGELSPSAQHNLRRQPHISSRALPSIYHDYSLSVDSALALPSFPPHPRHKNPQHPAPLFFSANAQPRVRKERNTLRVPCAKKKTPVMQCMPSHCTSHHTSHITSHDGESLGQHPSPPVSLLLLRGHLCLFSGDVPQHLLPTEGVSGPAAQGRLFTHVFALDSSRTPRSTRAFLLIIGGER